MAFYNEISNSSNFVISFTENPANDLSIYSRGYRLSAERLTKIILEASHFGDYEAYPIIFLYCHALELSLKHIIYSCVLLAKLNNRDDIEYELQNNHDFNNLSKMSANLLSLLFPNDEDIKNVFELTNSTSSEISDLIQKSNGFRYPIDKKGKRSTKKHQVVNLEAFANRLSFILEKLSTIHFGLNAEIDLAEDRYCEIEKILKGEIKPYNIKPS